NGLPAAVTALGSTMKVPESPMLDITGAITFETWLNVPAYQLASLISNDTQYGVGLDAAGRITCRIGMAAGTSHQAFGLNGWHHVACTLSNGVLAVHIDGVPAKCQSTDLKIPTMGKNGTRIAVGYVGAIDDIRIYARKLTAAEICTHADKTTCATGCN